MIYFLLLCVIIKSLAILNKYICIKKEESKEREKGAPFFCSNIIIPCVLLLLLLLLLFLSFFVYVWCVVVGTYVRTGHMTDSSHTKLKQNLYIYHVKWWYISFVFYYTLFTCCLSVVVGYFISYSQKRENLYFMVSLIEVVKK